MHKQYQPATRSALESPPNNKFLHRLCRSAHGGADEEECERNEHDELAAPDVGERRPDGAGGCVGEEVGAPDPGVACGRGEVAGYSGCGCGDDCCVEGRDEEGELFLDG